jgi:HemY protein
MRRAFLLLLLALLGAAALAWLLRLDAGYVLLQYGGVRIETTLWFALLVVLLTMPLLSLALRVFGALLGLAWRVGVARPAAASTRTLGRDRMSRGLRAFLAGEWSQSASLLAGAAPRAASPPLNYLLAARAAQAGGDAELARGLLELAAASPACAELVVLERARLMAGSGETSAAIALLEGDAAAAALPGARRLMLSWLAAESRWSRLEELLPAARRDKLLPESELDVLQERCFLAMEAGAKPDAARLGPAWDALPVRLRERPRLLAAHARALAAAGEGEEAQRLLLKALGRNWSRELLDALGSVVGKDATRSLTRAEALLDAHPTDAALLLALGRLALAAKLWGKARDYLESSLSGEASAQTCLELAKACEHLGDAQKAQRLRERAAAT